jgi:hypothetical protein
MTGPEKSGSLTTEYPANGSFSDHTHAVCIETNACLEVRGPELGPGNVTRDFP